MLAERIERQINHIEAVMRSNPEGLVDLLPVIVRNMRSEVANLADMEKAAFIAYLAANQNQTKEIINV